MYRSLRLARAVAPAAPRLVRAAGSRRLASTSTSTASSSTPKRTWKGAALRWGAAGAALYWYNTSPVFADDVVVVPGSPLAAAAEAATQSDPSATGASSPVPEEHFRTVDSVLEEKQKEARRRAEAAKEEAAKEEAADGPEALEAEAGQQGAFNPETGEINWDCPCLGGMAHGPCGEDFKAAFSCFVFSTEEPKGMDCIEKFQHMQDCFRKYPEIYGAELQDDEEAEAGEAGAAPGDVTEDKPANGAPTKAQIAERLAEDAKAGEKAEEKPAKPEVKPEVKPEAEAKPTESAEKPKKKTKAKKAKAKAEAKTEATAEATADKTATEQTQTESFPTAASDATASNAEPPAADDETSLLPKAAFDATGANK